MVLEKLIYRTSVRRKACLCSIFCTMYIDSTYIYTINYLLVLFVCLLCNVFSNIVDQGASSVFGICESSAIIHQSPGANTALSPRPASFSIISLFNAMLASAPRHQDAQFCLIRFLMYFYEEFCAGPKQEQSEM